MANPKIRWCWNSAVERVLTSRQGRGDRLVLRNLVTGRV